MEIVVALCDEKQRRAMSLIVFDNERVNRVAFDQHGSCRISQGLCHVSHYCVAFLSLCCQSIVILIEQQFYVRISLLRLQH